MKGPPRRTEAEQARGATGFPGASHGSNSHAWALSRPSVPGGASEISGEILTELGKRPLCSKHKLELIFRLLRARKLLACRAGLPSRWDAGAGALLVPTAWPSRGRARRPSPVAFFSGGRPAAVRSACFLTGSECGRSRRLSGPGLRPVKTKVMTPSHSRRENRTCRRADPAQTAASGPRCPVRSRWFTRCDSPVSTRQTARGGGLGREARRPRSPEPGDAPASTRGQPRPRRPPAGPSRLCSPPPGERDLGGVTGASRASAAEARSPGSWSTLPGAAARSKADALQHAGGPHPASH